MSQCPTCNSEVDPSFGLKNCPKCSSLVFVNVDGSVEVASTSEYSFSNDNEPDGNQKAPVEEQFVPIEISDSVAPNIGPVVPESILDNPLKAPVDPLKELEAFGNSESSSGQDGAFTFDVTITGIDSLKAKKDLKDALQDKRFMWETESLMRSIKNGVLVIKGLSAVKASVLIHRLKEQPLELKWEQYALLGKGAELSSQ